MEEQGRQESTDRAEPELLYHYTDQEGLAGILKDDCIWATHYRFLNDTSERRGALDFLLQTLERLQKEENARISRSLAEQITESMNETFERLDAYFVSFTQDGGDSKTGGDRLSQWRGYSSGGSGYSLGFRRDRLHDKTISMMERPNQRLPINLCPCIYREQEKAQRAQEVLQSFISTFERSESLQDRSADKKDWYNLALTRIAFVDFCAEFKDLSFREEDELRMCVYVADEVSNLSCIKFRDGRLGRIPYIELSLGLREQDSALRKIVVGPSPNRDQAVASLRIELAQMGINGIEVVPSQIPYRNW
jgi:hypothetical protein